MYFQFLRSMANWCTELQSLSLEGIRARKRRKDEKAASYLRSVRWVCGERKKLEDFVGLVQDCSNSIANALELPRSCAKPLIWWDC